MREAPHVSLPTSLALERPPSILSSRGGIGGHEHWVMTPLPASLVTVSRLRSVNRHTLCRLSLPPSVANGIVCRCKRPCWHTYQLSHYVTLKVPFCQPLNIPLYWQGAAVCRHKKSPPISGGLCFWPTSRWLFCRVRVCAFAWASLRARASLRFQAWPLCSPACPQCAAPHHWRVLAVLFGTHPRGWQ